MADSTDISNKLVELLQIEYPNSIPGFEILDTEKNDGYTQQLIEYIGFEKDKIRAYLIIPAGKGPFPGILIHHQHNSEWHLGKSEVAGLKGDPLNAFGPALAKSGFIVLAPDSVGFEDRRRTQSGTEKNEETDWLHYYNGMAYRLVNGKLLLTTVLNDALIATELLASLVDVIPEKIGILGHSYGGNTSIFHAAVDEKVNFICTSGSAATFRNKIENETGLEMSLVVPGILNHMDIDDILYNSHVDNMLIVSSNDDIYSKDADSIVESVQEKMIQSGKTMNLEHKRFQGGHALTQERFDFIIDWISKRS